MTIQERNELFKKALILASGKVNEFSTHNGRQKLLNLLDGIHSSTNEVNIKKAIKTLE